jgi:hypothetical protein
MSEFVAQKIFCDEHRKKKTKKKKIDGMFFFLHALPFFFGRPRFKPDSSVKEN